MTRLSSALLRRAYEHVTASAAAIALTAAFLLTVNAHAGNRTVTPSVTIQVPTVEIEMLDNDSQPAHAARVIG
ncbi:MAG TPA: hypothetical protein VMF52_10995 [Steroidobacteraceae bacterium]|nr:hypothetical protein [Steroidobacteraceae bacterium]